MPIKSTTAAESQQEGATMKAALTQPQRNEVQRMIDSALAGLLARINESPRQEVAANAAELTPFKTPLLFGDLKLAGDCDVTCENCGLRNTCEKSTLRPTYNSQGLTEFRTPKLFANEGGS